MAFRQGLTANLAQPAQSSLTEPLAQPAPTAEPAPQPPSCCQRLVGDTPGGLGTLRQQWAWAAAESHHMLFTVMPCVPGDRLAASKTWRTYKRCVARNPFYWAVWLPTLLLILSGRRLHHFIGQGHALGPPESEIEHEVRVWWVYPSDAAFVGGLCMVAADAVWCATLHVGAPGLGS